MAVSREKLYDEVWAEPMTTVAKRYDVSSNFLARVCERLKVPHPSRGYWARVRVGKALKKLPLPEPRPGDEIEWAQNGKPRVHMPSTPAPGVSRKLTRRAERPTRHPLLLAVRESFEAARVSREEYLKPYKRNIVDIFVSKETLKRALDVASELFLALEDRGHHVMFAPPDARYTRAELQLWDEGKSRTYYSGGWRGPARITMVLVSGVPVGLTLFEISAEFETRWDETLKKHVRKGPPRHQKPDEPFDWRIHNDWLPSGRLGLHAYAARPHINWEQYWREGKPGGLRTMLDAVAKELEGAVPTIEKLTAKKERENEEARRRYEEQQREWERKEAERKRVEREAAREKDVTETISRWRTARDVRAYVAEIQAIVREANLEITTGGNADEELKWALAYADRIDPLTSWRKDIEKVRNEHTGLPCPKCGKVHGANGANEEAETALGDAADTVVAPQAPEEEE